MPTYSYIHWPREITNPIMHSLQPKHFTNELKSQNLMTSTIANALEIWPEKTVRLSPSQAKIEIESVTRLIDGLGIDKQLLIQDIVTVADSRTVYGTSLILAYLVNQKLSLSKYILTDGVYKYRITLGDTGFYLSRFTDSWRNVNLKEIKLPSNLNPTQKVRAIAEAYNLHNLNFSNKS